MEFYCICPYCNYKFIIQISYVDNQFVVECPHCGDIIYTGSLNPEINAKEIFTE